MPLASRRVDPTQPSPQPSRNLQNKLLRRGFTSPYPLPDALVRIPVRMVGVVRPVLDKQKTSQKCALAVYGPVWVGHKAI